MAENKKIVVKKDEAEEVLKKLNEQKEEKVIEKDPFRDETKREVKSEKSFSEVNAEAQAAMALKTAINANSEQALKDAERTYFIEKKNHMLKRCKTDEVVELTVDKINAQYLGKAYTFGYNGIPVTVYCDGKPHKYPKFIADKIRKKLTAISESNTYKEEVDNLLS